MNYFITERQPTDLNMKNAANKARADVEKILLSKKWKEVPIVLPYKEKNSLVSSVKQNIDYYETWKKELAMLKDGDSLLIQFPPKSHSVLYPRLLHSLKKKGVKSIILIHDLEKLRYINDKNIGLKKKFRMHVEETTLLRSADFIIAHNPIMIKYLENEKISRNKLISLNIFDYVMQDFQIKEKQLSAKLIIAGNLNPEKVGYIAYLNQIKDVEFELYGVGFQQDCDGENIHYQGSFMPDELPYHLEGSFGLVWDGASADTCNGMYGNYLRYNNPHKTSLYLACGFPVVVWKESAIAHFIQKHHLGIAVASLYEVGEAISQLSVSEYKQMLKNVRIISKELQNGNSLLSALKKTK